MELVCAAVRIDSVALKFPFHSHVQDLSLEISSICRLKYVLLIIMLSMLFQVDIISLSLLFFM